MRGEQLVHARVESGVTQSGNFICSDARAPFQPLADGGLDAVEEAGVQARGFPCLNGGKISVDSAHQPGSMELSSRPSASSSRIAAWKLATIPGSQSWRKLRHNGASGEGGSGW